MTLVVDASAVVDLLLAHRQAPAIAGALSDHGYDLRAPHLVDIEVTSALRRVAASGAISTERAERALTQLRRLPIRRYPHGPLLRRVWQLRDVVTAYDASYLALAELLRPGGCPVLTTDAPFARAMHARGTVEPLLVE